MRKQLFVSLALAATLFVSAQQKNIFLETSFWKTNPDVATIQSEIANGNDPAQLNDRSFDAVVFAINNEAPNESIQFLLEQRGNSVSKFTHDNRNYLHWAAGKGNIEIVNYLIAKGSDINLEDSHGATPITLAAGMGQTNTAIYDALFKAGINPKKKYKNDANLLLLSIGSQKDLMLTNYFISKGMSIKDTDNEGNTAFNYAARSGNSELLKTLVEKGVKYTNNAVIIAAESSRRDATSIETYRYLIEDLKLKPTVLSTDGQTVLFSIVRKPKQIEIINYFLDKGVDVNSKDKEGNTALMNAASGKETEALELLLTKVKDNNIQNLKGESALTMAIKSGTPKAVEVLIGKGANTNVIDKEGYNLGFYLIQSYKVEGGNASKESPFTAKMKLLQDKGLNLAVAQKDGNTLFHFAVLKNDLSLFKQLSVLNIDVNAKNKDGLTVLQKAAMVATDDSILKYLISIGANKDSTTEFGETAYALAAENETLTKNNVSLEFLKS